MKCHEKPLRQPQVVHDVHACDPRLSSFHLAAQVQKNKLCLYLLNAYKPTPTRRLPLPDMLTPVPLPKAMFMYTVHMLLCSLHHALMKKALAMAVERPTTKRPPARSAHNLNRPMHLKQAQPMHCRAALCWQCAPAARNTHEQLHMHRGHLSQGSFWATPQNCRESYEEAGGPMCGINVLRRVNGGSWSSPTHSHEMPTQSSSRQHHRHLVKQHHTHAPPSPHHKDPARGTHKQAYDRSDK